MTAFKHSHFIMIGYTRKVVQVTKCASALQCCVWPIWLSWHYNLPDCATQFFWLCTCELWSLKLRLLIISRHTYLLVQNFMLLQRVRCIKTYCSIFIYNFLLILNNQIKLTILLFCVYLIDWLLPINICGGESIKDSQTNQTPIQIANHVHLCASLPDLWPSIFKSDITPYLNCKSNQRWIINLIKPAKPDQHMAAIYLLQELNLK